MSGYTARRALTTGAATAAILALTAGTASAHFCFRTQLSEQGKASSANSAAFMLVEDAVRLFIDPEMCDAGVALIAEGGGATPSTLINTKGTMAGGTLKKGGGNPAISHLDFAGLEAAIPDAYKACQV